MAEQNSKPGCMGGMAVGCAINVAVFMAAVAIFDEKHLISALAYLFLLVPVALLTRFILHRRGALDGWVGMVIGPATLFVAALLSTFRPITVEDAGGERPVTPHDAAEKIAKAVTPEKAAATNSVSSVTNHWEASPPPGVRYVPADTNCTIEAALEELNGLIGLKPVKKEVETFVKFIRVAQQRKEAGLKVAPISYHMVFTGNPGTGKTTVARIMAKIYRALGVVKNGHLVECDRGGLVAGYTGQTALKTAAVIDFALDGILFVDEAYALVNGPQDSYGDEAISTLLKRMEDDRDRLVVIVAGYSKEMKRFIDANSGLSSRFSHYVEFPDYTAEELAEMFRSIAKKSQYTLSADSEKWLDPFIRVRTKDRDSKFGNGRWVRNLFEAAVSRQAVRVADLENPTKEQLMTLTMHDIGIKLKDPDVSAED